MNRTINVKKPDTNEAHFIARYVPSEFHQAATLHLGLDVELEIALEAVHHADADLLAGGLGGAGQREAREGYQL